MGTVQGKNKSQAAAAYTQPRNVYKSKKAPGHSSGLRRSSQVPTSTKTLSVGGAGNIRSKYGYDATKYTYGKSKYRNN